MAHGYLGDGYGTHGERDPDARDRRGEHDDYRGYGRNYQRDRASAMSGRGSERQRSERHEQHRRHNQQGPSFWDQMKDEGRSWFGGADQDDRQRRSEQSRDWSRRHRDNDDLSSSRDNDGHGNDRAGSGRNLSAGMTGGDHGRRGGQDRSPAGYFIVEEYAVTFPNSNQDDHYRSWRSRQMQSLDSDYRDYCQEREHQFHRDFDEWRRNRQAQSPNGSGEPNEHHESGQGGRPRSFQGSSGRSSKEDATGAPASGNSNMNSQASADGDDSITSKSDQLKEDAHS